MINVFIFLLTILKLFLSFFNEKILLKKVKIMNKMNNLKLLKIQKILYLLKIHLLIYHFVKIVRDVKIMNKKIETCYNL